MAKDVDSFEIKHEKIHKKHYASFRGQFLYRFENPNFASAELSLYM
jgi:hypothetical protein